MQPTTFEQEYDRVMRIVAYKDYYRIGDVLYVYEGTLKPERTIREFAWTWCTNPWFAEPLAVAITENMTDYAQVFGHDQLPLSRRDYRTFVRRLTAILVSPTGCYKAARLGCQDLVDRFLAKDATLDINKALACAAQGGHFRLCCHLIARGATDFDSGLQHAVLMGDYHDLASLFLSHGASDIDRAFSIARAGWSMKTLELLLTRKDSISADHLKVHCAARFG